MIKGLYPNWEFLNKYDNIWLISDTHYGEDIWSVYDKYNSDERVAILNQFAHKNDLVIHLGDVGDPSYLDKWKCKNRILIAGNHEAGISNYLDRFQMVFNGATFLNDRILLSHEPVGLPFCVNIHGHSHASKNEPSNMINLCGNITYFQPINLKWFIEGGGLHNIPSIHRLAINEQTARKKKRESKNG